MSQLKTMDEFNEGMKPKEAISKEGTMNGNTPALSVHAGSSHGIIDIDLQGYAEKEHTHEEYVKKGDVLITEFRTATLFKGNANESGYYPMSEDITKFRYVIIFAAGYNGNYGRFVQKTSLWFDIEDLEFTSEASEWSIIFRGGAFLNGTFINNNTFQIRGILLEQNDAQYLTVRKIVGIY